MYYTLIIISILVILYLVYRIINDMSRSKKKNAIFNILLILLTIMLNLLFNPILKSNNIDEISYHLPKLHATLNIEKVNKDSIEYSFTLKNTDIIPAQNVRYGTITAEDKRVNFFNSSGYELNQNAEINLPPIMFLPFILDKDNLKLGLVVYYDVTLEEVLKTFKIVCDFFIRGDLLSAKSYDPLRISKPEETVLDDYEINQTFDFEKELEKEEGGFILTFEDSLIYDNILINLVPSKFSIELFYSPTDSVIYFINKRKDGFQTIVGQKLKNIHKTTLHPIVINWNDKEIFISVDFQEIITDSVFLSTSDIHAIEKIPLYYEGKEFLIMDRVLSTPTQYYQNTGIREFLNKNFFKAILNLKKSLELDSVNNFMTFEKLFLSYDAMDSLTKGIDALELAVKRGHNETSILVNLALAYENLGKISEAEKWYNLDHEVNHSEVGFLNHMLILINNSRLDDAQKIFNSGTKYYPNSSGLFNNYGLIDIRRGNISFALMSFFIAYMNDTTNVNVINNIKLLEKQINMGIKLQKERGGSTDTLLIFEIMKKVIDKN